ncbi:3D-(3,5/4)-trihydroxycyclohexane-1,2-dione acylhydrolase (decyclizing) [Streptomyces albidoflavus]|uniref:3D-(3,5/4)-trihydroxycyclohexane-1,2-dione acylhydrolase (decyclizing) n=1 Tax=Streptomyces TaxID=1883 RepID=UPI0004CCBBCC|nr:MULTISPECIES: 3D-(3,5/4)-trihydroxycyclohexane-1,2-dione acylhydrolase (decyclizing) [Streptomyces]AMM10923.1 IolD protein [Streptomyces albidoflavus]KUL60404.1 3D-(3,5/4)-trihydroxycyclohexane-1,2-dione acylhydrolase (decyclizing) [Streptomyces albidoflavus]WTC31756.1 3D-(3,5/4)-trihydroxycyclohexane-1,2-dione acylhydrolase (decyclizing) [Streptomyces albidoflavus]
MRLTTAQALIRFLSVQYSERDGERQRLIPAVWGVFGHGNVAGLGQALAEHTAERPDGTGDLRFHQGRSEQAMVHAATGFARQSRRLAAHAVTTSIGPGATNLVTGAALATVNRLPVLLLPGDTFATRPADPVLQQLELPYAGDITVNDCLRPVSRHFDRVTRPEALIPAALTAMRVLTDPAATGAVTLALPQDVQAEAYDWPEEFFAERTWHIRRPAPDTASLTEAAALLRAARRPLVVAGGGVKYAGAEAALDAFARATGIPVAATQAGKGALPHDHPQDVGALGHTGTATADDLARAADLVLAVGTRLTDFTTASGTLFAADGVRFAHLNLDPADAHKLAAHAVVGDAREGLTALTGLVAGHRLPDAHITAYTAAKADWEARVDAAYAAPDPTARPTQTQLLGALDALVTGEDILVNAAGSLPGDLHRLWRARSADQYHVEYGYSCMGYEIPGALGILLADPHRPVWALVGDGTYLMNPTELVTAVQESLPLKLVLVDNHGYASIGGLSRAVGAEGFGTAYRMPGPGGLLDGEPLPLDLAANAASLGVRMLRAETVAELGEALAEVRTATVPTGVYVRTETPDTVSSPTPAQAWWDVPVARTAHREEAARARQEYDRNVAARRRHL